MLHDSGTAAIQTSCFCRAELNSGMKFDKSTAEARRLNQTFELSSALNYCANPKTLNSRIIFGMLLSCEEKANEMQDGLENRKVQR